MMTYRVGSLGVLSVLVLAAGLSCGCDPGGTRPVPPAGDGSSRPGVSPGGSTRDGAPVMDPWARARNALVDTVALSVKDTRVLDAMRKVPRHEFVPEDFRSRSYRDEPLPIGQDQTISQPTIVGVMSELLELDGTERVLEVGTGSGYQAAVLGELAGKVFTIEIRPSLSARARAVIERLNSAGVLDSGGIEFVVGDGSKGWPEAAPYDAIIVTAAPSRVPQALREQLKPGGRLVIPVGDYYQELLLITKSEDGGFTEKSMKLVRFVRLVEEGETKEP